ncbi:PLP-dependent aminotransferase family protein [Paenibacillus sp. RC67]|uniref:aminotransferase-like domain-containing protein n=1 Tax=Paenibacillus sp. RC67 TaxID=3039392 RepID=UPI0024AD5C22|nr:PLP-dependent aminotransferase family protein [Paenibacillus sp. RC67]
MVWKLDTLSEVPIFRQIYMHYEQQILHGSLLPGAQLPTERDLAINLGVNRSTVSAAYDELRAMGLVNSIQGSGTRVCEFMWEETPASTPNWERYSARRTFDPTSAIVKRTIAAFPQPGIINLTKGELSPDLMPLELLKQLTSEIDFSLPFSYYANFKGDFGLRETLSHFLKTNLSITAEPNHILITAGVKHALHLIANTLLQPGDAIAVEGPSYLYGMQVFSPAGLRMVKLPVDKYGLIPEKLPELYHKHRVRMVFVNPTYQNPTGTTLPLARRKKLLDICEQLRLPIVEDDPYGLLRLDPSAAPIPPLKALSRGERFVIYLGTLSKVVTPGMRLGWIVAPSPVISQLADAKNRMGYSTSHAGERLAQQYLSAPASFDRLNYICDTLRVRRNLLLQALKDDVGDVAELFAPQTPAGGYYISLQLKQSSVTDKELLEAGIQEGVLISPGSIYGAEKGFIRLTYASVSEDQIVEGIQRLGLALRRLSSLN